MSDPFGNRGPQPDKDPEIEKKPAAEGQKDLPSLNFDDVERSRAAGNAAANSIRPDIVTERPINN